jgi:hypothetical protein
VGDYPAPGELGAGQCCDLSTGRCRQGRALISGIAELAVFGSVARGEATPASDVDVLYVLRFGAGLGFGIDGREDIGPFLEAVRSIPDA